MTKLASGDDSDFTLDDLMPPPSNGVLETIFRIARQHGVPEDQLPVVMVRYFRDVNALLEIPKVRISSVMFASLARRAVLGKKDPPKSLNDVGFISSYLPYCDAMFVDKESAIILRELPRETPQHLRLSEFGAKVFSLNEKDELLAYLDELVADIPADQVRVLQDLHGDDYAKPYWEIIEQAKQETD